MLRHQVRSTADLEYAEVDGHELCLDLHRPELDGPVPCVVYFHGGGWARGSRTAKLIERLLPVAAAGIAVASVSYRFTDVATHPAQLEDARAAVRWLRAHGGDYGLQTDAIGAWGASAGGWIALMLCLTVGSDPTGSAQAAVAWMPPTDLTTVTSQREAAGLPLPSFLAGRPAPLIEAGLLGLDDVGDDIAAARAASPVTHAAGAHGPVMLIHGTSDGLINAQQSVELHRALLDAGHDSQLLLIAGANHEDDRFQRAEILGAVAAFFSAQL